jgi:DNA recombination protein RmuC
MTIGPLSCYGWRQDLVEKNAQTISDLGKQIYERTRGFVGHFEVVGSALARAVEAYNRAAGSLESRVLPSARRFRDLGAAIGEEIITVEAVDENPRTLTAPERNDQS